MKYAFIHEYQSQFTITTMCRVLDVSRQAYYAWRTHPHNERKHRDEELTVLIERIFRDSDECYGSPRVHLELRHQGVYCGHKRVARLMRERQLRACSPRRFVVTTDSNHAWPLAENVLDREYQVEDIPDVNRTWAGDITYIPTAQGWLYLAVVLDLKSRKVIGWSMATSLEQKLVHDALQMAVERREVKDARGQLLFHSDRGSQYAAHDYQTRLKSHGVIASMSRRANCWDNAPVESFFATLKKELVHRHRYATREQATLSLFTYIEVFYNRKRRHSALGYLSPHDYEQTLLN